MYSILALYLAFMDGQKERLVSAVCACMKLHCVTIFIASLFCIVPLHIYCFQLIHMYVIAQYHGVKSKTITTWSFLHGFQSLYLSSV